MALGTNNISLTAVYAELNTTGGAGSAISTPSKPWTVSGLVGVAGQNPFSFYGPWHVIPHATTKFIEIDYGVDNYKLGDFRLYNHTANKSDMVYSTLNLNYDPTESTLTTVIPANMSEMNVLDALSGYSESALYLCHRLYYTESARNSGSGYFQTLTSQLDFYTPTTVPAHTRTATRRISSTQTHEVDMDISGMSGTDYIYVDTYVSNSSGAELLRLGDADSDGHTVINMTERAVPYIYGDNAPAGSGLTGARVALYTTNSKCSEATIYPTPGDTSYSFYVKIMGNDGVDTKLISSTSNSADFRLYHYNHLDALIETIQDNNNTLSNSAGIQLSGSCLAIQHGHYIRVELDSVTWGSLGTACP